MAYKEPGFVPLPQIVMYVSDPDAACRYIGSQAHQGERINGCAEPYGRRIPGHCLIILPHNPEERLVTHEKDHCERGKWHN
jgi:hypothetical protein